MSEQERATGYKEGLLAWATEAVINPLLDEGPDAIGVVKQAIWEKVLESYRNGMGAKPRPQPKLWRRPTK